MKKAFVFFTDKEKLTSSSIGINPNKIRYFDDENKILTFSKEKQVNDINFPPYIILIKDSITLNNPKEDGTEQGNSAVIKNVLKEIDEIYLVIHESKQSNCLETFERLFSSTLKSWIYSSHGTNSIYNRGLKIGLNNESITDLSSIEESLLVEFHNPYYEAHIHLYKSLSLIPIKFQGESLNEESFVEEITKLKEMHGDKIKLAIEKLNGLTLQTFYNKLDELGKEISNFSIR